jgi:hypothetical protein
VKKCRICKKPFNQFNSMQVVCSPGCAHKHGKLDVAKKVAKQERIERKVMRERRNNLKTYPKIKAEAQTPFNKFIRLRDFKDGCISCERTKEEVESTDNSLKGGVWDAGHFKGRGARPDLSFNELNVHKQCKVCNGGSGKYVRKNYTVAQSYRESLIIKIGLEEVEALEVDNNTKASKEELIEIKKKYLKKALELKKNLDLL